MPPLIVLTLSAVGAVVVGKWLAREARRVSAALRPHDRPAVDPSREPIRPLVQDPVTGVYRPK